MVTLALITLALIAALVVVGGIVMLFNHNGNVLSAYCVYQGIQAGFSILGKVIPAILEAVVGNES